MFQCKNFEACKGNDTCLIGYQGLLCEECDLINGFSLVNDECKRCDSKENVLISSMIVVLGVVIVILS